MQMQALLQQLVQGQILSEDQAIEAFSLVMDGVATPAQTAALLALIEVRGARVSELVGAARVMSQRAVPVTVPAGLEAIDTCGTGGDHAGTFNISTAAALVAAAAGRPRDVVVAKHGNRSVTSRSGSSQVLEALGVKLQVSGATLTRCLEEAGICFCFAPAHHPAMRHAAPVRADLGFRTLFNLVGPLTNPAGVRRQVVGVFRPELTEILAEVLAALGRERALVVHGQLPAGQAGGAVGLDELSCCGPSRVTEVRGTNLHTEAFDPTAWGLPLGHPAALFAQDAEDSAAIIRRVLAGEHGPCRDIVAINAGAALRVADLAADFREGIDQAMAAIDSGAAARTLDRLITFSQAPA